MTVKPLRVILSALAAVAITLAVTATPAMAHAKLVESDPADGDTVDKPPAEAVLTFSEELDEPSTQVALTLDDTTIELPDPKIEDTTITQSLSLPEKGEYTLSYRIVSEDGHPVDGSISFTTESGDGSQPATSGPDSDGGDDTAAPDDSASGGVTWPMVAAGAAVVVVVVALVTWLLRRGRG